MARPPFDNSATRAIRDRIETTERKLREMNAASKRLCAHARQSIEQSRTIIEKITRLRHERGPDSSIEH